ncbi:peptidoglycan editing factor PgeF [Rhodovibrionaceae bacterium A322]
MLTDPTLQTLEAVRHGFLTRKGGKSRGIYEGLNCGFGSHDSKEDVAANRQIALERVGLPDGHLLTCYQIHSPDVVEVTTPWAPDASPKADATVTRKSGIALGVLTADCAPVLFADAQAGVIGAAHAGWKGAIGGVLAATVSAMEDLGAKRERIVAAIGPCIAHSSYEVGPDFPKPFLQDNPDNASYFWPKQSGGKPHFDLKGFVGKQLERCGLSRIGCLPHDTYADPESFFSYRRTCHRQEGDYGRGLSLIYLEP